MAPSTVHRPCSVETSHVKQTGEDTCLEKCRISSLLLSLLPRSSLFPLQGFFIPNPFILNNDPSTINPLAFSGHGALRVRHVLKTNTLLILSWSERKKSEMTFWLRCFPNEVPFFAVCCHIFRSLRIPSVMLWCHCFWPCKLENQTQGNLDLTTTRSKALVQAKTTALDRGSCPQTAYSLSPPPTFSLSASLPLSPSPPTPQYNWNPLTDEWMFVFF